MKKLLWILSLCLLCPCLLFAQKHIDPQKVAAVDLIIPSPAELATWGKVLQVIPDVTIENDIFTYYYDNTKLENSTIYLGRTLALLLLGIETLSDETIGKCFIKLGEGMRALDIKKQYIEQFEALSTQFGKKQLKRDELANQLDLAYMRLTAKAEGKLEITHQILQGAAWVQGQNLLAKAMQEKNNYRHAKLLLHRPAVTQLILDTLNQAKQEGRPAAAIDPMMASLENYRKLTAPPHLGANEVSDVIAGTDQFLKQYQLKAR